MVAPPGQTYERCDPTVHHLDYRPFYHVPKHAKLVDGQTNFKKNALNDTVANDNALLIKDHGMIEKNHGVDGCELNRAPSRKKLSELDMAQYKMSDSRHKDRSQKMSDYRHKEICQKMSDNYELFGHKDRQPDKCTMEDEKWRKEDKLTLLNPMEEIREVKPVTPPVESKGGEPVHDAAVDSTSSPPSSTPWKGPVQVLNVHGNMCENLPLLPQHSGNGPLKVSQLKS